MARHINDDELLESELENQIPEAIDSVEDDDLLNDPNINNEQLDSNEEIESIQKEPNFVKEDLGTLTNMPGRRPKHNGPKKDLGIGTIGDNVYKDAEYIDGWIDFDRSKLGDRNIFYPKDWQFMIRPANVDAIKNWSTLDEENANSIWDVFNEILKTCLAIKTPEGKIPWGNVNSWDRFYFMLIIREYTFIKGESKLQYDEDCPECDNPVTFTLTSNSLMFDMPDPEVMEMYDQEGKCWHIDPEEFDVNGDPITLYLPTLDKDANIKAWVISKLQENKNKKIDPVFIKFLSWMAPKISKDLTIADRQIKGYLKKFKELDTEMFTFLDDVIRNIVVTPSNKLITKCPVCGEEVTSDIRFQNGIRDIFTVRNKHKKFGTK